MKQMKTVKPMKRAFIAKLLVLCMVVALLPTVALAAETNGNANDAYYEVKADVKGSGSVYVVGSDASEHIVSGTYKIQSDAVKNGQVTVKLAADQGYRVSNASYAVGADTVYFTASDTVKAVKVDAEHKTVTVHAVFDPISGGSVGGGGGVVTPDTVTEVGSATTSGSSSVVEVSANATVSNGMATAAVNDTHMSDAVSTALAAAEANDTAPVVEIVVDTGNAAGLELTLGSAALDALGANPDAVLRITSDAANLELNADAIASVGEQATGNIVVTVAPADDLSSAQKEAVGTASVYEVSITTGGRQITEFGAGTLTVGLPYTLAAGQSAADVQVFYLDGTEMFGRTTSYKDGIATFTTDHLSHYVIGDTSMSKALSVAGDVMSGDWFAEAVKYVYTNELMEGTPNGFEPNTTTTRAMVVTTLYRLNGAPAVTGTSKFTDVEADKWYTDAVIWAEGNGVVEGTSATTFAPNEAVTREQMATMLYRYADKVAKKSVSKTTDLKNYTDTASVSDWALTAVKWANAEGLMKGTSSTRLTPGKDMNRAELATFLMRFNKNIVK